MCVVFLCKQKTAYQMRISDWRSDVCSSDLRTKALRVVNADSCVTSWFKLQGNFTCRLAMACVNGVHQICMRMSPLRTILSPGLQWNASANAGRFDTAPLVRNSSGACGSLLTFSFRESGAHLSRSNTAYTRKKRCTRT